MTMNDPLRDAAFRAGFWQVVEQRAKQLKDEAKADLKQLQPGDAVQGKWHGQPVAKASMVHGRTKLVVTDEQALLDWVTDLHPTELVYQVNPAFMKQLETRAKELGHPVDSNGELVPGVELVEGEPYVSVRKAEGAEMVIAELFRTGKVGLDGIQPAPLPAVHEAEVIE
jgi:hypothetical protein